MENEKLNSENETEFLVLSFQCPVVSGKGEKEAPLPSPPPTTASRGEGDDYAAGGGEGAAAAGAAIGNFRFQMGIRLITSAATNRRKLGKILAESWEKLAKVT